MIPNGYELLAHGYLATSLGVVPGSGATVTLWASETNVGKVQRGLRYKRIIVNVFSSHASATSGLSIKQLSGATYREIPSGGTTVSATTYTVVNAAVGSAEVEVTYTNSASVLTAFEYEVLGDTIDRSSPS